MVCFLTDAKVQLAWQTPEQTELLEPKLVVTTCNRCHFAALDENIHFHHFVYWKNNVLSQKTAWKTSTGATYPSA
jgi:hypothetical protein